MSTRRYVIVALAHMMPKRKWLVLYEDLQMGLECWRVSSMHKEHKEAELAADKLEKDLISAKVGVL
jgi:hypothetical protein